MTDHIKVPIVPAKTDGTPQDDGLSYCGHGAGWSGEILSLPIVPSGHGSCIKAGLMPIPQTCKWDDDFSGDMSNWSVVSGSWSITYGDELKCSVLSYPDNDWNMDYGQIKSRAVIASGDFDVQVSVSIGGTQWFLFDFIASGGGSFYRIRWEADDFEDQQIDMSGAGCPSPIYSISPPSELRMIRTGTILSGYYDGNLVGSCDNAAVAGLNTIQFYWESYYGDSLYIDNVVWNQGCPP